MGSVADILFFVCPVVAAGLLAYAGIYLTRNPGPAEPADEVDGRAL